MKGTCLKTRWTLQKLPDHKNRLHKLKFQCFFMGPQPWDTPKNCQRKPNNLLLVILNPWICQFLLAHHLRYGKPVIPWSSIFSVARQQASLSSSKFPDRLRGPRSRSGIAFSLFTADVPKSQGTPHVECQWCDFSWKMEKYRNITRTAHSSWRIWLDLIGKCVFGFIFSENAMPALNKIQKGASYDNWLNMAESGRCSYGLWHSLLMFQAY